MYFLTTLHTTCIPSKNQKTKKTNIICCQLNIFNKQVLHYERRTKQHNANGYVRPFAKVKCWMQSESEPTFHELREQHEPGRENNQSDDEYLTVRCAARGKHCQSDQCNENEGCNRVRHHGIDAV